jgi:signal transduction histidine kinase
VNLFKRYFLYRTILFISIFGITIFFLKRGANLLPLLFFLLLFVIDEILVYTIQRKVKLFNILIDSTYLSVFIVFTGGVFSPFAPFYFTLIVMAAYLLSSLDSFVIAGYVSLLYGLINLVIPNITGRFILIDLPEALIQPDVPDVLLKYIIYSLSFIFTAALSSFIVDRFRKEMVRLSVTTEDVLDAIDYGIITLDDNRRIVWSNKVISNIIDRDIRTGMYIGDVLPKSFYRSLKKIFEGKKKDIEFENRGKVYKVRKNALRQGQGVILIIYDITHEKEIEKEMQMREKLVTLGQFAANLAHGVRNPVSSIRASAELFDLSKKSNVKNRRLKKLIIEESDHLDGLVTNFLDFTRNFEINKVEISLSEVCSDVIDLLEKSKYYNNKITIKNQVRDKIKIKADHALLKSILLNIGTNSLKAMINGGNLIFNAKKNKKVVIEVKDTGCGIDRNNINKIFSSFYSGFNDGFGFGLAIVKKIIELHGWKIDVQSEINKGTTIRIII